MLANLFLPGKKKGILLFTCDTTKACFDFASRDHLGLGKIIRRSVCVIAGKKKTSEPLIAQLKTAVDGGQINIVANRILSNCIAGIFETGLQQSSFPNIKRYHRTATLLCYIAIKAVFCVYRFTSR